MTADWETQVINSAAIFAPLLPAYQYFNHYQQWPTINDYNQILTTKNIQTKTGIPLTCISQPPKKSKIFIEQYEPGIYLQGQLLTRENHWHDFFNMMVWLTFPKTKAEINALQYSSLKNRLGISNTRSMLENVLTLFDENGAIIVSHNEQLLHLLKEFRWKELFWQHRKQVLTQMRCYIFGHSVYEKALNPYLGMTASSIIFLVSESFFAETLETQLLIIDEKLSDFFAASTIRSTKEFMPLPILGFPGWDLANEQESYYDNTQYFRTKKYEKEIRFL